ncbi:MAG: hypothetical protein ACXVA9_14235 [Bdellovibrionales bacterium]
MGEKKSDLAFFIGIQILNLQDFLSGRPGRAAEKLLMDGLISRIDHARD